MPYITDRDLERLRARAEVRTIDLWPMFWSIVAIAVCAVFAVSIIYGGCG